MKTMALMIGDFQWEVMQCIAAFPQDANATGLQSRLSKRLDRDVDRGEVSRAMKKLAARGYVVPTEVPSVEGKALKGRPRQFYGLTPDGRRVFDAAIELNKSAPESASGAQPLAC